MQTTRTLTLLSALSLATLGTPPGGCERKPEPAKPASPAPKPDTHAQEHDGHHDDDHAHGPTTELGEQSADGFTIRASRDGDVTPGKDVPIDVWVTPGTGTKVSAVRLWIGTRNAKGSVKARAEIEQDRWHTHAEVPSPMPEGGRLWVEVEAEGGAKTVVGFDLKL